MSAVAERVRSIQTTPQTLNWAGKITAAWNRQLTSIFETGQLLIQAKDDIGHGLFQKMIADLLPFSASTAQCLMAIARNPQLTNAAHARFLPPKWPTLYILVRLSAPAFKDALENGYIYPDMTRQEANTLVCRDYGAEKCADITINNPYLDNPYDADLAAQMRVEQYKARPRPQNPELDAARARHLELSLKLSRSERLSELQTFRNGLFGANSKKKAARKQKVVMQDEAATTQRLS